MKKLLQAKSKQNMDNDVAFQNKVLKVFGKGNTTKDLPGINYSAISFELEDSAT